MPRPINSVTNSKPDHINYHTSAEFPLDTMLWSSSTGSLILEGAVVDYVWKLEDWPSKNSSDFDWFAIVENLIEDSTIYKAPRGKREALRRTGTFMPLTYAEHKNTISTVFKSLRLHPCLAAIPHLS